jgi:hypothetical protein
MHLTYFATPLELRSENVSKINENFDFHCKCFRICSHFLHDNSFLELSPATWIAELRSPISDVKLVRYKFSNRPRGLLS